MALGWIMVVLFLFLSSLSLEAQQPPSIFSIRGKIVEIRIEGLRLIEKGTVRANINTAVGMPLSPGVVSEDIKTLFKLDFFKDISVDVDILEPEKSYTDF